MPDTRARKVCDALHDATQTRSKNSQRTKGIRKLVMTEEPQVILNSAGDEVGVQVWIELTVEGVVQDIDPHRVFINPPTSVVVTPEERDEAGVVTKSRECVEDPVAALWEVLWQSVDAYPSSETKARRGKRR